MAQADLEAYRQYQSDTSNPNPALETLRGLPQRIADLLKKHGEERIRIASHQRLSNRATTDETVAAQQRQTEEEAALVTRTLESITALRAEADKSNHAAQLDVNRRSGRPEPADSNEALLREMREQRAWARLKPLLDQTEPAALHTAVGGYVIRALAEGDDDTIFALRAELPAYTEAKGVGDIAAAIVTVLDDAVAQSRPGVSDALRERRELEGGMKRLLTGFTYAEHAVINRELSAMIPGWDKQSDVIVVQCGPVSQ